MGNSSFAGRTMGFVAMWTTSAVDPLFRDQGVVTRASSPELSVAQYKKADSHSGKS